MKRIASLLVLLSLIISFFFWFLIPPKKETHFIFIAGGSAVGKTTFTKYLTNKFGQDRAFYISLDEYLDKRVQPKSDFIEEIPNFDNPSMVNWKLLMKNISKLQRGESIQTPIYDFSSWMPSGFRKVDWKPVVIIEGIHALQDELDSCPGLRIYIDANEELQYQRRLFRDITERHYTPELSKKIFFEMAIPYQKIFLEPTRNKAHIVIDNSEGKENLEKAACKVIDIFEQYKDKGKSNRLSYLCSGTTN